MTNLNDVVVNELASPTSTWRRRLSAAEDSLVPRPSKRDVQGGHRQLQGSLARALSNHDMPLEEIRAVLLSKDPAVVARYMELHRERLAEELAQRVRELEALERIIARRSRDAARSDEFSSRLKSFGACGVAKSLFDDPGDCDRRGG